MQIHQLKPTIKPKARKRVARGGKRGTYSGRGLKGQKSRAGHRFEPSIRLLIKRYPKLRGYRFEIFSNKTAIVNIGTLAKKFKDNEVVSPETLLEKRLVRKIEGKAPRVKILAQGELKKPLVFESCVVSKQAKEKIEKSGGTVKS